MRRNHLLALILIVMLFGSVVLFTSWTPSVAQTDPPLPTRTAVEPNWPPNPTELEETAVITPTFTTAEKRPSPTDNSPPPQPQSPTVPDAALGNWFHIADDSIAIEDVAYNSYYNEYLVAWAEIGGNGYPELWARVYNSSGEALYPAYRIGTRGQSYTQIAYNSRADEYLVAWDIGWFNIYVQRLNFKGEPIGSDVRVISSVGSIGGAEALAYSYAQDEYMLLFNKFESDGIWAAHGQRINSDGTLVGGYFQIGADGFVGRDMAYNWMDRRYLIVGHWDSQGSTGWDIHGQFLNLNGTLYGSRFAIETYAEQQSDPRVAWNYDKNQYLVAWLDNFEANDTPDVYGRRLTSNGSTTGNYIPIATGDGRKWPSEITYNWGNQSYLVVWDRVYVGPIHDSYAKGIRADGTMPLPSKRIWSPLDDFPRVTNGRYDQNLIATEINGKIWARFAKSWESVYLPAVLNNVTAATMPSDPYFINGSLWGLHNTGQNSGKADADIDAPEAWAINTGSSNVVVAIIDTGVDLDHPEFSGRLTSGYDFANNDSNPNDDEGHGTHVAGTISAQGNNGIGVAGIAWNVRIMPVKGLDSNGRGYYSWWIQGIDYAINHNAKVINMSLSGTSYSQSLQEAVNRAYNNNILVIAAAGNCGDGNYAANGCTYQDQPGFPGAMNHVLAVASTTRTDTQSSFSTQGSYVDIAAPGSTIWSTCRGGGYCINSGTSMAAPHVAGLAALIYSQYPNYSPDQAARALVHNANDLGTSGRNNQFGCGRINAYNSLKNGAINSGCSSWSGLNTVVEAPSMTIDENAEYRPGVLLVKFNEPTLQSTQEQVLANNGLTTLDIIENLGIYVVGVPVNEELEMMAKLESNPTVAYAEPDFLVQIMP